MRRKTRRVAAPLLLFAPWFAIPAAAFAQPPFPPLPTTPPMPLYRDTVSRVEVYDVVTDTMFPAEWHSPRIAASALPIAATERARAVRSVKVALSKYPPLFVQTNLKRVYLVGSLTFKGVTVAATNSATCLYLSVRANNPRYTDAFIEGSFHHEFGHLLQRNYQKRWSADAWMACNLAGFRYGAQNGVEAVRTGHASLKATDDWNRRGFVSEYGASYTSEDFATVAAKLFIGDPDFWKRVDTFPALKAKVGVAIGFYKTLDVRFNEAYFCSLRAGIAYAEPAFSAPVTALPLEK